jgi:hypothetical protein
MQVTIHKLVWHLQAASQQAAAAGQKAAAELSRSSAFLAELETRLEALHLDEEHVVISKLEIDIGRLSEAEFNQRFASEFLRKLQLEVGEIASEKRVAEVKHVPLAQKRAAEFVYFVYTGNLPVNWPSSMRTQSEVAHWLAAEVAAQNQILSTLEKELFASKEKCEALAKMPAEIYFKAFLGALQIDRTVAAEAQKILRLAYSLGNDGFKKQISLLAWRFILQRDSSEHKSILEKLAMEVQKVLPVLPKRAQPLAKKWLEQNALKRPFNKQIKKEELPEESNRPDFKEEASQGYFIQNAGLVLIAPFLINFFSALGVSDKKVLTNTGKALALLAALDLGAQGGESANKTLYKLLTGLALDADLPETIELTTKEKHEAKSLLDAVIGYWPALKNTSPDGLRTGFFWREGVLTQKDHGYLLKVETKAQDILLGSLPWSISIIKLPWMDEPLHVDWA